MGIVYPDFKTVIQKSQHPTEGELALLKAFEDFLPDDCEIFFQPYLNGDRPDIVILRKGYGAHIVEVKDWDLSNYNIDGQGNWSLNNGGTTLLSPLVQVQRYKENLFNLHVEGLLENKLYQKKVYGIVTCSVYFHKVSTLPVLSNIKKIKGEASDINKRALKYTELYGNELLTKQICFKFLNKSKLHLKSQRYTDDIYRSMRRIMAPPFHYLEEGVETKYTPQQEVLIQSLPGKRRKIKGVAGSGKTLVLAKRAVNAFKITGSTVLILTYNITLINYIHDLINNVREGFPWNAFEIVNYHEFFNSTASRHNLVFSGLDDYDDTNFFELANRRLKKYQTILIDEAQDFHESWHSIIQKYFLSDGGELVVFADEKQNIYSNELDSDMKVKVPGIPGVWNESMNRPFRFTGRLVAFIKAYQESAFTAKYALDEFEGLVQAEADIGESAIQYISLGSKIGAPAIVEAIQRYLRENNIHPSDTTILNSRIALIREMDYLIRKTGEVTHTTFETKQVFDKLSEQIKDEYILQRELEKFRRNKKRHFWMKTGTMKLSTIHSFKGWEINTAIVIIESENNQSEFETAELIYTGLTRARVNLLIINIGNTKYDRIIKRAL